MPVPVVVAAELSGADPVAHAVADIGVLTAQKGLALCGRYLAEELVLLPDLEWAALPDDSRCGECLQTWTQIA